MNKLAVLVLAAGRSTRFDGNKLLHRISNKTLIEIQLSALKKFSKNQLWVITGEHSKALHNVLRDYQILTCANNLGIGDSIATGINVINQNLQYEAVLITLADQIALSPADFDKLSHAYLGLYNNQHKSIIATKYDNSQAIGVPAIFPREYFPALQKLTGGEGAKSLLKKLDQKGKVQQVYLPAAKDDIDTQDDLTAYLEGIHLNNNGKQ